MPLLIRICIYALLAALGLPGVAYLTGTGTSDDYIRRMERRSPASFPAITEMREFGNWLDQMERALIDRFPFRGRIIETVRSLDHRFGGRNLFADVSVSEEGWLFFRADSGRGLRGPDHVERFFVNIETLLDRAARQETQPMVIMVPSKQFVYPDKLPRPDRELFERYEGLRRQFYGGLETRFDRRVPPVWRKIAALRQQTDELIYHPEDTHYTHLGAIVVAQAIVDGFSPGLWDPEAVVEERIATGSGDLVGMAGFTIGERHWDVVYAQIERPGVSVEREGGPQAGDFGTGTARFRATTTGPTLIPGRTLILHDSFIGGFVRESLAGYFEDVTYVHLEGASALDTADFDRVVIQINERNALSMAIALSR